MLKKLFAGLFQSDFEQLNASHAEARKQLEHTHQNQLADLRLLHENLEQECAALRALPPKLQHLQQQLEALQQAQAHTEQETHQAHAANLLTLQDSQTNLEQALATAQSQQAEAESRYMAAVAAQQQAEAERDALKQNLQAIEAQQAVLQARLQQLQQAPAAAAEPPAPALIRPPARPHKRVLIVDDAATTRALQKNMLESAGFEVVTGQDGEQGCRLIAEHLPDLVITDVEMPRMDGFELTRWIKQSPYREVPVLMVTSFSDEAFRVKGRQAGANGFVEKKSFNQTNFLQIVGQYL